MIDNHIYCFVSCQVVESSTFWRPLSESARISAFTLSVSIAEQTRQFAEFPQRGNERYYLLLRNIIIPACPSLPL
jgi:hypothetical protein